MEPKGEPRDGAEGLPEMDGSCDACEPDEARPATQVCHTCSFAFCPVHAGRHAGRTRHPLTPYSHEAPRGGDALGADRGSDVRGGVGDAAGEDGAHRWMAPVAVAVANADVSDGFGRKEAPQNGPEGTEAGQEAAAAGETGKRDAVTVERLRCKEHGQEGALYCKADEKIVCVVCAVRGEHREHEIITLREAYVWQKSRRGYDLLGCTQQMAEKIKTKWTDPETSADELEAYVNDRFDELRMLVHLEERRTLHLVDLKEASLTASAAEKIAEIGLETERLQEEMAVVTDQLSRLEQGPPTAEALMAAPGGSHRLQHDIEARPRLPEPRANPVDPQVYEDDDVGPSLDHAP